MIMVQPSDRRLVSEAALAIALAEKMDVSSLDEHIASLSPHPVYDDMIDLVTLVENGLV